MKPRFRRKTSGRLTHMIVDGKVSPEDLEERPHSDATYELETPSVEDFADIITIERSTL